MISTRLLSSNTFPRNPRWTPAPAPSVCRWDPRPPSHSPWPPRCAQRGQRLSLGIMFSHVYGPWLYKNDIPCHMIFHVIIYSSMIWFKVLVQSGPTSPDHLTDLSGCLLHLRASHLPFVRGSFAELVCPGDSTTHRALLAWPANITSNSWPCELWHHWLHCL